jgi:hypothetical protein
MKIKTIIPFCLVTAEDLKKLDAELDINLYSEDLADDAKFFVYHAPNEEIYLAESMPWHGENLVWAKDTSDDKLKYNCQGTRYAINGLHYMYMSVEDFIRHYRQVDFWGEVNLHQWMAEVSQIDHRAMRLELVKAMIAGRTPDAEEIENIVNAAVNILNHHAIRP